MHEPQTFDVIGTVALFGILGGTGHALTALYMWWLVIYFTGTAHACTSGFMIKQFKYELPWKLRTYKSNTKFTSWSTLKSQNVLGLATFSQGSPLLLT